MIPNLAFAAAVAVFATGAILWVWLGEPWVQARADRKRAELDAAEYQAWLNRDAGTVAGRVLFVVAVIAATILATVAVT